MIRLLVFGGTTEGRELAGRLADLPLEAVFCVASEYGREALSDLPERFRVLTGRLDENAIRDVMRQGCYSAAIDATHPYAVSASANIRAAAAAENLPCWRVLRPEIPAPGCLFVSSAEEAAERTAESKGNVLLATGTKELAAYTAIPEYADRLYPRVLPTAEAIQECERMGFRRDHIIAMFGPFGRELNRALMMQHSIRVLVTKDGGAEGGFAEKIAAADDLGIRTIVIGRPPEHDGMGMDAVLERVAGLAEAEP